MRLTYTLGDAVQEGETLAARGHFPTIYVLMNNTGYALALEREWPPHQSRPALKWDGDNWIMMPNGMKSIDDALQSLVMFRSLGLDAVAVEFHGICYDVFVDLDHVPPGAWMVCKEPTDEIVTVHEI